ncbi:F-box protein At5g07610-like [Bidens hawaiensis]|uniref:F-box protein At5g07610-like n=1 Tax=Bidens hawaiensis TaxID=980011 RepID=UPI00404A723E
MPNKRGKINKTCINDSNHQPTQPESLVLSNDDLLTEILIRLPVTSILRFKSVSKHWRWLLTHTHFTHRFDNNISKSHGLFFSGYISTLYVLFDVENRSTPPFRSLDIYINRPQVNIVQSCNGLLLCCSDRGPQGGKGALKYYVFNPTTKQLTIIPPVIGGYRASKTICLAALAFHQNQTGCVHYKVVCIRSFEPRGNTFQIQIYSSETRKWKICTETRLQTLPLPEGLMSSEIITMYLGESRGHLHFIAYENREENGLHFNVFEMLSDQSNDQLITIIIRSNQGRNL